MSWIPIFLCFSIFTLDGSVAKGECTGVVEGEGGVGIPGIKENVNTGTRVFTVTNFQGTDPLGVITAQTSSSNPCPNPENYFTVQQKDDSTLEIIVANSVDDIIENAMKKEDLPDAITCKFYVVCAKGTGSEKHLNNAMMTVVIEDVNDNPPVISASGFSLPETFPVGLVFTDLSIIDPITATDRLDLNEENYNTVFDLDADSKEYFEISTREDDNVVSTHKYVASLSLKKPLNYDEKNSIPITIIAKNVGDDNMKTEKQITLKVENVNNQAPEFKQVYYSAEASDGMEVGDELQILPEPVEAVDPDGDDGDVIQYSLKSDGGIGLQYFEIDSKTAKVTLKQQLDENILKMEEIIFTLEASQASDHGRGTAALRVVLQSLTTPSPTTTTTPSVTETSTPTDEPSTEASGKPSSTTTSDADISSPSQGTLPSSTTASSVTPAATTTSSITEASTPTDEPSTEASGTIFCDCPEGAKIAAIVLGSLLGLVLFLVAAASILLWKKWKKMKQDRIHSVSSETLVTRSDTTSSSFEPMSTNPEYIESKDVESLPDTDTESHNNLGNGVIIPPGGRTRTKSVQFDENPQMIDFHPEYDA